MNTFRIHCQEPWFSCLKQGVKPVEGRKNSPKYQNLQVGDNITFHCEEQEEFSVVITKIETFKSIEEYLESVGLSNALPGIDTIEEGLEIYRQWSSAEDIQRFGFMAIWVSLISPHTGEDT